MEPHGEIYMNYGKGNSSFSYSQNNQIYFTKTRTDSWRIIGELVAAKLLDGTICVPQPLNYKINSNISSLTYKSLSGEAIIYKPELFEEAGRYLAKIHSVKFSHAGRIDLNTQRFNIHKY